jgi:predicted RNA-binding Zn-ribbon protein involved in translation (DUF1610 family)
MDQFADRSARRYLSDSRRTSVVCSHCQFEVSDPGDPLSQYRCPRCGDLLIRMAVPLETGSDRQLPAPRHVTP